MNKQHDHSVYVNCEPYISRNREVNELVSLFYKLEKNDPLKALRLMESIGMRSRHEIESYILRIAYHGGKKKIGSLLQEVRIALSETIQELAKAQIVNQTTTLQSVLPLPIRPEIYHRQSAG